MDPPWQREEGMKGGGLANWSKTRFSLSEKAKDWFGSGKWRNMKGWKRWKRYDSQEGEIQGKWCTWSEKIMKSSGCLGRTYAIVKDTTNRLQNTQSECTFQNNAFQYSLISGQDLHDLQRWNSFGQGHVHFDVIWVILRLWQDGHSPLRFHGCLSSKGHHLRGRPICIPRLHALRYCPGRLPGNAASV